MLDRPKFITECNSESKRHTTNPKINKKGANHPKRIGCLQKSRRLKEKKDTIKAWTIALPNLSPRMLKNGTVSRNK